MLENELRERATIEDVINRFANLEIDVPAQAELFTPDVVIEIHTGDQERKITGREQMKAAFSAGMAGVLASHHQNGQQVIEFEDATHATDTHYCQATLLRETDGQRVLAKSYVRYVDSLVKQDGSWLIAQRDQTIVFTEEAAQ